MRRLVVTMLAGWTIWGSVQWALAVDTNALPTAMTATADWPTPTNVSRPWTRWWWLGSAVDAKNLSRLLETAPKAETNDVIVSHGNPYRALHPGTTYLREGEAAIIRPSPGGGHEVYALIAWDEWPSR